MSNSKTTNDIQVGGAAIETLKALRNFAIIAHIDAGKTTLTERMIFYAKAGGKYKIGEVHHGDTTTDYLAQERERGITIVSAAVKLVWNDIDMNLIDSPGHVDFTVEVERSLSVLEGCVVVIDASAGVQPQTECVWRQSQNYGVSKIIFLNKMDKEGASFPSSMESLKGHLSKNCIAVHGPYIKNEKFTGVYDLVFKCLHVWEGKTHIYKTIALEDFTVEQLAEMKGYEDTMYDEMSDRSEVFMEKYLAGHTFTSAELVAIVKELTLTLEMYPVFCGTAFHNKGVQQLLDAIVLYLPNPIESMNRQQPMTSMVDPYAALTGKQRAAAGPVEYKEVMVDYESPYNTLFCFKWVRDRHLGPVAYCRVYSGSVKIGDVLYNSTTKRKSKITNLVIMFANQYTSVPSATAGDIIGIVSQDVIITGDVLSNSDIQLKMTKIKIPDSIVHIAIRPKTEGDQDKFGKYIGDYMKEDPTIGISYSETKEMVLKGVGSLQLEVLISRLKTEKKIDMETFPPKVAYRTTIGKDVVHEYLHKKQTGGSGQFARVKLGFEKCEGEYTFTNKIKGGSIPEQFIPAIRDSLAKHLKVGVHNCPVIGLRVKLLDGEYHKVDSSDHAFQEATRACLMEALPLCDPLLLEPYADLTVFTPSEYASKVISDICSRGGSVISVDDDKFGDNKVLQLEIAMKYTFNYIDVLRSLTSGYANCMYTFKCYKTATEQPTAE